MRTAVVLLDVLVGLLLVSTLICGLWMYSQPVVEPSSVRFHMTIGIGAVIAVALALTVSTFAAFQVN